MAPPPQRSQQRRASESTQHSKRKISSDHNGHSSPSEADEDEPRVAQWENDPDNDIFTAKMPHPEGDLSMPFSALLKSHISRKYQSKYASEASSGGSDNSDLDSTSSGNEDAEPSRNDSMESKESYLGMAYKNAKRVNKHAPVEVTSKRPVTRRRAAVDVNTVQSRDPRFLPLSGDYSSRSFHSDYAFLVDLHKTELGNLKDSLKRAKRMLNNSPKDLFAEREAEVERLERAVKRAESTVNRDRREAIEREAIDKVTQGEKERRQQGKKDWYMRSSEKKDVIIRARHDAMMASGGRTAIKKAIEKRQKKVAQKEKRMRPNDPIKLDFTGEHGSADRRQRRRVK